jgi:transcriptional regulator with XRE-family HTH domain
MQYETIGELIAALLEERQITAYRLARDSGVNESYVHGVLSGGIKNVGMENLSKMLAVLAPGKSIKKTFELVEEQQQ